MRYVLLLCVGLALALPTAAQDGPHHVCRLPVLPPAADGAGELLVDYGTPTRSRVVGMANGRAAIEVLPGDGRTVIEARNQDFKGSYLELSGVVKK